MITDAVIRGRSIHIRQIALSDCNESYLRWMNDPEVNQYMETRWGNQNEDSIRAFVESQRNNEHSYLFAIIENASGKHIGNIKIGPIHPHYQHADISYFIGEKEYWHRGIATEAIALICAFGFDELKLHRIEAGAYEVAVGSWRALEKNGFEREGIFRDQACFDGRFIAVFRYGIIEQEWRARKETGPNE